MIHLSFIHADHAILKGQYDSVQVIVAIYVDDLIIISEKLSAIDKIKRELNDKFDMKYLGELQHCLGLKISRDRTKRMIMLSQEHYISRKSSKVQENNWIFDLCHGCYSAGCIVCSEQVEPVYVGSKYKSHGRR